MRLRCRYDSGSGTVSGLIRPEPQGANSGRGSAVRSVLAAAGVSFLRLQINQVIIKSADDDIAPVESRHRNDLASQTVFALGGDSLPAGGEQQQLTAEVDRDDFSAHGHRRGIEAIVERGLKELLAGPAVQADSQAAAVEEQEDFFQQQW